MALVLIAAAAAAGLVAGPIGPALFDRHMAADVRAASGAIVEHAEMEFAAVSALTLAVALTAATLTALAVSLLLARRMGSSLGNLSRAASEVAAGRFDLHLIQPHVGIEFDNLAEAFNTMAEQLEEDQRVRRLLTADVANELRTPVATISTYLDALEEGLRELTPTTLEVLRAQACRLTRLASDLAAVTQAESGILHLDQIDHDPADLLVAAVLGAQDRADGAGVALVLRIAPGLPDVRVDPERFGQVLGNLLDNAIRHTPAGGKVTLSAASCSDGVRIVVADTGDGIAQQYLPHVFERFYRVNTSGDGHGGGSGLGLAIAKALVRAHGGSISAHSPGVGQGAWFIIDLPVA
ncbi:HAMP domain-containing sensor histidine kinase [Cellulomonas sp. 73-92]|uniref:HAMP domain-containing sensor histidine kinase n=1 Tax=Cellulomonas sp. 73-92 TaxID=1895740 RepID=UPI0025C6107B|nr:HAMP domain-containing sensor histidine kinase [Cellulomonas sp. 73-92]